MARVPRPTGTGWIAALVVALSGAVAASACAGTGPPAGGSAPGTDTAISLAADTTTTTGSPGTSGSTASTSSTSSTAAGGARCTSAVLGVEARPAGASAGHRHDLVIFTNTGAGPCWLRGYPGVSYLDASGAPAGPPAERLEAPAPRVVLAPGEQAHASLNGSQAYLGTPECGAAVEGVTLQVFPPDETVARTTPYEASLCSALPVLRVGVVEPGTDLQPGENAGA
jgi:hypothetical protein